MKKLTLTLLVLSTLFLAACNGNATPTPALESIPESVTEANGIIAEGKLAPVESVELSFSQPGAVAEVLAQAGDEVDAGDVIARLEGSAAVQAEIDAAKLEETLAQQALEELQRNSLMVNAQTQLALLDAQEKYESEANGWNIGNEDEATRIELVLERYVEAEEQYREAREELEDLAGKDETNPKRVQAQEDYERKLADLDAAYASLLDEFPLDMRLDDEEAELLQAIAALELARDAAQRVDTDPLQAAEERLQAATAHVQAAEEALENYELRAPFAGTLLSMDITAGETAAAGLPVAFVADPSRWQVETTDLAEVDAPLVAIGSTVSVLLDAFPGEVFTGEVTGIDPVGYEHLGDMTYKVTILLDESDARFLWNMTATVTIER